MIAWFKKILAAKSAPQQKPASQQIGGSRHASPENCALWRDVARALDAKPKGFGK
jgi:hypothetical protein